ncbi:hypothetical protein GCM10008018_00490 [Paenibacillus marchantiophytorum]|uniref:Uncharacterized protein n=1 Tax=Paenibacillus marchantiophytorum TaxID=1619310 RepID=A0ABQ2BMF8_9BACL|nr:hypothetical protein [Paenibacillus marchantiophytorum]GGI43125.1 hypothetical protein GCM10008018_00490 [Paenibacillus marchantiophytorum]
MAVSMRERPYVTGTDAAKLVDRLNNNTKIVQSLLERKMAAKDYVKGITNRSK